MFQSTSRLTTVICQVLLTIFGVIFALPLVVMFAVSLQGRGLGNYQIVLETQYVPRFFLNSVFVTFCTIVIVYAITLIAAYAFSKLRLRGGMILFNGVLIGLMIPGGAVVLPLFLLFRQLNLFDNYLALILPFTAGVLPFATLLVRNFLDGLPDELIDAAKIDGCNSFTALLWVIMPLSKPISIVVIIWSFLAAWNDYFTALVYIRDDNMLPLTHLPNFFIRREMTNVPDMGPIFASLVLISLPIIITYMFLQRYFEDGLVSGALK
jgi:raffinose/stachyose/melibiose transport system permease protein